MKAVFISGEYAGSRTRDIVNDDPNLMLVFGDKFLTMGTTKSAGPVIALDDAHFMGPLTSDSVAWVVDRSVMQGQVSAQRVIFHTGLAPNLSRVKCDEVWIGDYGWPKHHHPLASTEPGQ